MNGTPKEPLKCLECGDTHLLMNFPLLNKSDKVVHILQEASTAREIGKCFHRINASLDDRHANHQSTIVGIECTISNQIISILINLGATLSLMTPRMMDNYEIAKVRHAKPWLVQLAIGEKRKVTEFIANCEAKMEDRVTRINLNIFPLQSYAMIIGM